jgi:hypothetical protein
MLASMSAIGVKGFDLSFFAARRINGHYIQFHVALYHREAFCETFFALQESSDLFTRDRYGLVGTQQKVEEAGDRAGLPSSRATAAFTRIAAARPVGLCTLMAVKYRPSAN